MFLMKQLWGPTSLEYVIKFCFNYNFIYIFYAVGNERKTLYYCIFLYNLKNCQKGPSPVATSGQKGPSPMATKKEKKKNAK